jgi:hypothetical protein
MPSPGPFAFLGQVKGRAGSDQPDFALDVTRYDVDGRHAIRIAVADADAWVELEEQQIAKLTAICLRHLLRRHLLRAGALQECTTLDSDGRTQLDVYKFCIEHLRNA